MRLFGKFCAIVALAAAFAGVIAIDAAHAETATWWGEDVDFDSAVAGHGRSDPQACADYPQATCTCAHSRFALGTHLKVNYHGRSVVCRVNDVRPFDWTSADIVLSFGAARVLGIVQPGQARVAVERMGRLE